MNGARKLGLSLAALAIGYAGVSGVQSCSVPPPEEFRIGVPDQSSGAASDMRMRPNLITPLAKEYQSALSRPGRHITLVPLRPSQRLDALREKKVELVFGCVGEMLDQMDHNTAKQVRGRFATSGSPDTPRWRDVTHSTLLSATPSDVGVSDPGLATPCPDPTIPQNTVALYDKPRINREDRRALNNVAGGISTQDLEDKASEG
ncbi:hypothetical protein [Corynebacterium heidelbergense]|uniref:hypothetical protein n=1 Tax=Corynebacterium heidelbergense TaxID=2055947 RepID=UPI001057B787|nr:hypothetical protein [Corynebacterium heidelbergense]